ncbi:dihydrouridine synthase-domain-containing protein [Phycomyces nitens]|nr:dihydrouridine synthase-domain-containing protein [Phycomyces nitens]
MFIRHCLPSTTHSLRRTIHSNASSTKKLEGYDFYEKILGSPKHIVAPMVEQSEQAWRILSKRYDSHLCFTPMFHAKLFSDSFSGPRYRKDQWTTDEKDRPLVVQFCANDPETLLKAAKMAEHQCDAIDLNLGCPQNIAKRGRYGSFLQDEWEVIASMISLLHRELAVPVTAKIRVFPTIEKTIAYAKMLQDAGAQILTVHGRLREQKGHHTGLADWDKIKAVKDAVKIPVFANGNILYHEDIQRCLDHTGADGVMSGEGHLYNPTIFTPQDMPPLSWAIAQEYLEICRDVCPTRHNIIKSHLFKIFHPALPLHTDLREKLGRSVKWEHLWDISMEMKKRLEEDMARIGEEGLRGEIDARGLRKYGHWRCQPYFRPELPLDHGWAKGEERRRERESKMLQSLDDEEKMTAAIG